MYVLNSGDVIDIFLVSCFVIMKREMDRMARNHNITNFLFSNFLFWPALLTTTEIISVLKILLHT